MSFADSAGLSYIHPAEELDMATLTTHADHTTDTSRRTGAHRTGLVITVLASAFLAVDAVSHLLNVQTAQDWNQEYGAPEWFSYPLGIALAVSLIIHLVPRTALLGATLITGYLGGAIAVNLFLAMPAFNSVFAFLLAVLVWGGLWLRDDRVKVLYAR